MNAQDYRSVVLFTPPRLAEERKTYWPGMAQYSQAAVATAGFGGLGQATAEQPRQNMWADFLNPIHNNFIDLVDTFTGAKGQREAQANALTLAQMQAQQSAFEAQQRAEGWGRAAPWLAVGGALVAVAVMVAAKR